MFIGFFSLIFLSFLLLLIDIVLLDLVMGAMVALVVGSFIAPGGCNGCTRDTMSPPLSTILGIVFNKV